MNYKIITFLILNIIIIAITVKYLFQDQLELEILYGFICFILFICFVLLIINHKSIVKEEKLLQIFSLGLAFISTSIWFIGELLVYFGKNEHPLLETIGAAGASIGSLLALIIFLKNHQ